MKSCYSRSFVTTLLMFIPLIILLCFLFGCKGRTFKSQILDERRTFFIQLPQDYTQTNISYPVLYILDAYEKPSTFGPSFYENAKMIEDLTSEGILPMIIVGLKNTHRNRDMIPLQTAYITGGSGGPDNFLSFLTEEMIPLIDHDYRTSRTRILYGRSDSGLFVLYALAKNSAIFSAYISSSPTVGHCPDLLQEEFAELFSRVPDLNKQLYIVYGENDIPLTKNHIPNLAENLKKLASPQFRFYVEIVSGSGHIPKTSLEDGLRFVGIVRWP